MPGSADLTEYSRPCQGIATDAAHSTKQRVTKYQAIDLSTGKMIFYKNLGSQTANIGEFLALVEAVKYILLSGFQPRIIYTDSTIALSWFQNKDTASKKRNKDLQKAVIFLKAFAAYIDTIIVRHWDNKTWGENPADFGNK